MAADGGRNSGISGRDRQIAAAVAGGRTYSAAAAVVGCSVRTVERAMSRPEVKALVASKPSYTTKDIVEAQLAAVLATPPAAPTTVTTTTRTTPHAPNR